MKTNKILFGGITGGIAYFFLGWIVYGILLKDFTTNSFNQCAMKPDDQMIWWALIASNLASGFLLAFIFSISNTIGFMSGIKIGAIVGLLIALYLDLSFHSMTNLFNNFNAVIVDIVVNTILAGIVGACVAQVMSSRGE